MNVLHDNFLLLTVEQWQDVERGDKVEWGDWKGVQRAAGYGKGRQ